MSALEREKGCEGGAGVCARGTHLGHHGVGVPVGVILHVDVQHEVSPHLREGGR